jgi:hypothetical protein
MDQTVRSDQPISTTSRRFAGLVVEHQADKNPGPKEELARRKLFSVQPDGHSGLDPRGGADWIGPDRESIEVVVADGTGGAPGGEFAARGDFVYPGIDRRTAVGQHHLDGKPDTQTIELVFAQVKAGPPPAGRLQCHQRLARDDRLARLRDEQGDSPVRRRANPQFGDPRSDHSNCRDGNFNLGIGDRTFLTRRPETGGLVSLLRTREVRVPVSAAAVALSRSWCEANPVAASCEVRLNCRCA